MNIENRLFEQYFIEFIWTLVINPFVLMIFFLLLLDVNCLKQLMDGRTDDGHSVVTIVHLTLWVR
jgi:hypothetical protein